MIKKQYGMASLGKGKQNGLFNNQCCWCVWQDTTLLAFVAGPTYKITHKNKTSFPTPSSIKDHLVEFFVSKSLLKDNHGSN